VLGLVTFLALAVLAAAPGPAAAAKSCGHQILDDWSDGRIDRTYPLRCYADALDIAPRDLLDYSNLEDDVDRALAAATRGTPAPPNAAPETPAPAPEPVEEPPAAPSPAPDPDPEPAPVPESPDDPAPAAPEAAPPVASAETASSVPLPLLVLAGLALLLLAGGSAGYLVRRVRGRATTL
jgi:hypothetical protein